MSHKIVSCPKHGRRLAKLSRGDEKFDHDIFVIQALKEFCGFLDSIVVFGERSDAMIELSRNPRPHSITRPWLVGHKVFHIIDESVHDDEKREEKRREEKKDVVRGSMDE